MDNPIDQSRFNTPLYWQGGETICLGDVVKCGHHIGAVYWSDFFQSYQVSVGTGLTLCSENMNRLEFVRRGDNKLCQCGRPYPVNRAEITYCQCGRRLSQSMRLAGMSDQQFAAVTNAAVDIQYLIVAGGGIATKTAVEDALMARYGLNRADAHTVTNFVESRRDFTVGSGGVRWQAQRPERLKNYENAKTFPVEPG